jgi:AcrR family transcriptional regulator
VRKSDRTKERILDAAVIIAETDGLMNITRAEIAHHAQCAEGLINKYYGTMKQLRRDIMRHAIAVQNLELIAQGLAAKDPRAMAIEPALKRRAINAVMG